MQPTNKEMVVGRGVQQEQRQQPEGKVMISQAQLQQMQLQMNAMRDQLEQQKQVIEQQRQQQPVAKMYTLGQVQVLLACETIDQVLQEFDVSALKKKRLLTARDYLLMLGEMSEFVPKEQREPVGPEPEPGMDQEQGPTGEQVYEDPAAAAQDLSPAVEPYEGQAGAEMAEAIANINRKMAEIKSDEKIAEKKEKAKTGFEKIKEFIGKKGVPEKGEGITEGIG